LFHAIHGMETLVIAATLAGSAGGALLVQKTVLKLFFRAMEHRNVGQGRALP